MKRRYGLARVAAVLALAAVAGGCSKNGQLAAYTQKCVAKAMHISDPSELKLKITDGDVPYELKTQGVSYFGIYQFTYHGQDYTLQVRVDKGIVQVRDAGYPFANICQPTPASSI